MITPAYVRTMAAYNAEMNQRLYGAAARLSDAERRQPRGAFWGSIHGTLNHLLWGDRQWMSRFDNWPKPDVAIKQSAGLIEDFAALSAARETADADISRWAAKVDDAWMAEDLVWFSAAAGREMRAPKGFLISHFFNHQTHHRGQVHAMLTAAGQETGDTDLFLVVPGAALMVETYEGGCHCGRVRFRVRADLTGLLECNCSICTKKGILHLIVPPEQFELLEGEEDLATYQFNTNTAKHTFCRHCGIHAFYVPRSDPDKISVNARCLEGIDPAVLKPTSFFDGRNWEQAQAARQR